MKSLAKRLIWARHHKSISQATLAKMAGVAQSAIGNLEAGTRLSSRKITTIAAALGVSARWLSEGVGEPYTAKTSQEARLISPHEQVLLDLIAALPKTEQDELFRTLEAKKQYYDARLEELMTSRKKSA